MWPFNRKKQEKKSPPTNPVCPHCASTRTVLQAYHGTEQPDYVRTWRGQRYWDYRCLGCGQTFYTEEPPAGTAGAALEDDRTVDDEDELRAAEEDLKRQTDEEGDHTYR